MRFIRPGIVLAGLVLTALSSVRLDAQSFANVPELRFTKTFAGANPLPQVVTAAATDGSVMRFTATATTTTGGSWLTISPSGTGCCYTPEAISVTVNPLVTLAAGTYSGQVVFTSYPTPTFTLTIPVTLTVAAAGTPFFDATPGQMTFSLRTGGVPPAQSLQLRNGTTGALNWSAAVSTADGGNWLSTSAASGPTPATISVAVTPGLLPGGGVVAGTYVGQLRFNSTNGSVTIAVNVVVGDTGFTQVNPLSFTKPFGGANPPPQTVLATTTSSTVQRFTATAVTAAGGNWLVISPSGTGCCYTPEAITVSVNPSASLAAGSYTGQVTFVSYPGNDVSMTIPVTLTVAAAGTPYFDNVPGQMTFSLKTGRTSNPAAQTVQIRNAGTGTLGWSLTTSTADGNNWLSASAASGQAPSLISVTVTTANLPNQALLPFQYTGQLVFRSATGTVTVPINVTVADNAFNQMNPVNFTKPFGGANPLPQILPITAVDVSVQRFTVAASSGNGGNWLQVSPSGIGCCYTPEALTVSVNPSASLAAGSYTGEIVVTAYPSNDMVMTIPVTLTIAGGGTQFLGNLPGQLSYSLLTGRTTNPSPQVFQITAGGTGALNWQITSSTADGNNWLHVSPASGSGQAIVTVSVARAGLPDQALLPGTFIGQIVVKTATSTVTIPVSTVVGNAAFNQINPISFSKTFGGANPLPQLVTAVATDASVMRFTVTASTGTGGSWLTVQSTGVGCCYTPDALTITVNPSPSLQAGIYTGQITLTAYPSNDTAITIPVTMTVAPAGGAVFDNGTGQLSYSLRTGAGLNPPPQGIQIANAGSGTLNWGATTSTSDGNNWLSVSPTSGTAPTIVAINVTTANLPNLGLIAGTFTGQVLFRSAAGSMTIPVSVFVGDGLFTQGNPISFTMPAGGKNPLPQILMMTATDGSVLRFTSASASGNGGNWLHVTSVGVGCCYTPDALTVTVDGTGLAAGHYTGEINLTAYPSNDFSMTVVVTLTVTAPGGAFFDNTQGQMTFSMQPGGGTNPASQTIQIRNGGSGAFNWTALKNTSDSNPWLSITAASGTAPSTLGVTVITNKLPNGGFVAGNFTGQVVLRSPTGNATVPATVAVGDSVFVQPAALTFSMTAGGANPIAQTFSGASTNAVIRYTSTAVSGKGGSWLQISPTGVGCCNTPTTMTVSVNGATLAAGTYTGEINFLEYPSNDRTMTLPVILVVNP